MANDVKAMGPFKAYKDLNDEFTAKFPETIFNEKEIIMSEEDAK